MHVRVRIRMRQPKFFIKAKPAHTHKEKSVNGPTIFTTPAVEQLGIVLSEASSPTSDSEITPSVVMTNEPRKKTLPSLLLFGVGVASLCCVLGIALASHFQFHFPSTKKPVAQVTDTSLLMIEKGSGNNGLHFDARVADARVDIVKNFLSRYKSPLTPYDHFAQVLVDAADRNNLDYRLLPAIMMQESNLCKTSDPAIHNCLGFGIHKRGTLSFDTYEDSFDRAAKELKERYIDIGLVTPEQIMRKYTPSSNGSWANSVNQWIAEMEYNSRELGIANKSDADLTAYSK